MRQPAILEVALPAIVALFIVLAIIGVLLAWRI